MSNKEIVKIDLKNLPLPYQQLTQEEVLFVIDMIKQGLVNDKVWDDFWQYLDFFKTIFNIACIFFPPEKEINPKAAQKLKDIEARVKQNARLIATGRLDLLESKPTRKKKKSRK